jgi:ABC-type glycerol-3-phosphate transport system substrate-binding protein
MRALEQRDFIMRTITLAAAAAASLALAACGGDGDDALGEQAQENMENKADAMDAAAENMAGPAGEQMEQNAEAVREAGDRKEEAIDNTDVDTDELTAGQKNAIVNAQ